MKQIPILLIMLFATFSGYGDEWDVIYQSKLNAIERRLDISPQWGYDIANDYASDCSSYVLGFVHGNMANENYQEYESKRYSDWRKAEKELIDDLELSHTVHEMIYSIHIIKEQFKLNCQYEKTLKKETFK